MEQAESAAIADMTLASDRRYPRSCCTNVCKAPIQLPDTCIPKILSQDESKADTNDSVAKQVETGHESTMDHIQFPTPEFGMNFL